MVEDWQSGGFGLYIHWPFCEAKCPYCDFNSFVSRSVDHGAWRDAYISEIRRSAAELGPRSLNSVYFGGGTPSLMEPKTVGSILDEAAKQWNFSNDIEITLEANPSSVEVKRFQGYRSAGVNRVSLGVQALNGPDLKALGRVHTVAEALDALKTAKSTFDRISFDLIYGRQNQSLEDWQSELIQAVGFGTDHLSLYQLTIEPGTAFGDRYKLGKLRGLPSEDLGADMYDLTQEICKAHGMPAYEVSNHAAPDQQSRHNLIYWNYGDYVGIGPGAHGRVTLNGQRHATETHLNPTTWLTEARNGNAMSLRSAVSSTAQGEEYLMMSLRTTLGLDRARHERLAGHPLDEDTLRHLQSLGMIEVTATHVRTTSAGRPVLNAIIQELAA
ncbi:MAG: radical SAM family heme chaperone HemW [Paracoccaceae bacterium]